MGRWHARHVDSLRGPLIRRLEFATIGLHFAATTLHHARLVGRRGDVRSSIGLAVVHAAQGHREEQEEGDEHPAPADLRALSHAS